MNINRGRAVDAFKNYVAAYNPEDPKIALKISHTWRVAELCERIARSLLADGDTVETANETRTIPTSEAGARQMHVPTAAVILTQEDVDLAWLLGLLHDIGRFEQVRRYGTFNDSKSISHAALGARILFDAGLSNGPALIRSFVEDSAEDELIRTAVALHSVWRLPDGIDARTRCFCEILRDADKVDILKVNCVNTVESIYGFPERELLESQLSDDAASWFWRHSTIPREARHYPADILLGHICFVWELVYPESLRTAVEQGYVFQMLERPFTRADTRETFVRMEAHLKNWLADKGFDA